MAVVEETEICSIWPLISGTSANRSLMAVEVVVVVVVVAVVSSAVNDVEGGADVWTTSGGTYPEGPGWGSAASIVSVSVSVSIPVSWTAPGGD